MKTKMFAHFQICISVPLSTYNEAKKNSANSKTNQSKKPKREGLDPNSCTFLKSSRNQIYIFIE